MFNYADIPSIAETMAKGAEHWGTVATAQPMAQAKLGIAQQSEEKLRQDNVLGMGKIEDSGRVEGIYAGIDSQQKTRDFQDHEGEFTAAQQEQMEIKRRQENIENSRKLAAANRHDPLQASRYMTAADREQEQLDKLNQKALDRQSKYIGSHTASLLGIKDQMTLEAARSDLTQQAEALAKAQGIPEDNVQAFVKDALKNVPTKWDSSAQYWRDTEVNKTRTTKEIIDQQRADAAAKAAAAREERLINATIQASRKTDIAAARGEMKGLNDSEANTLKEIAAQRLVLASIASPTKIAEQEAEVKRLEEASKHWFSDTSDEEKSTLTSAKDTLAELKQQRQEATEGLASAQQRHKDIVEMKKAMGKQTGEKVVTSTVEKVVIPLSPDSYSVDGEAAGMSVEQVVSEVRANHPKGAAATDKEIIDAAIKAGWIVPKDKK